MWDFKSNLKALKSFIQEDLRLAPKQLIFCKVQKAQCHPQTTTTFLMKVSNLSTNM